MYKLLNKILLIIMNIGTIIVATIEFTNNNYSRIGTIIIEVNKAHFDNIRGVIKKYNHY